MTQVSVTTINSALFDQKYAIQCNLTNATEMTQVSVTTINSALFDQKIYRGYLHNAFLVVLLSAFFISKNTTCIGMLWTVFFKYCLYLTSLFHTLKSERSTVMHKGKCDLVERGDGGGEIYQHFCIKQIKCWHVALL